MPRTKKIQKEEKKTVAKKASLKKVAKKTAGKGNDLFIKVYDVSGSEKGEAALPKEIFRIEAKPALLAQYVRVYLARQRQGTASTKTRGDVTGSTRKIYRQKGTGRARHGDIKAPIFVGGGIVGGPKPRDYFLKLNKKQKRLALFSALTLKNKEGNIMALTDEFLKIKPKTKVLAGFFHKIGLNGERILLLLPKMEKNNLVLAARNIPNLKLMEAASVNAYEVLRSKKILVLEKALEVVGKHFLKS